MKYDWKRMRKTLRYHKHKFRRVSTVQNIWGRLSASYIINRKETPLIYFYIRMLSEIKLDKIILIICEISRET